MREIGFTERPKTWSRFFVPLRHGISAGSWMVALVASLFLTACFLTACGGSKKANVSSSTAEGDVDVDKLLNTPADQEKQNAEDAEVLRLLGIEPTKTEAPKPEPTATPPASAEMQKEIERLQKELTAKDQQVADLRNSLMERDARLQQFEQQTNMRNAPQAGADGYLQRYAEARNLYEQRRYNDAMALFQEILAENEKSSYADNCQYWIGECYYGMGKYEQAIAEFEKVFKFTHSNNKSDAAALKLGLCYVRLNDHQQARSWFEQLIARYPNSPYVANARKYLTRL